MGGSPYFLIFGFICCEERGMNGLADLDNRSIDTLAEASYVANLFQKRRVANKDDLCAESVDFEYRTLTISKLCSCTRHVNIPHLAANLFREPHVLLGSTSKTFPSKGTPGG
jgi:hypothetical protein